MTVGFFFGDDFVISTYSLYAAIAEFYYLGAVF